MTTTSSQSTLRLALPLIQAAQAQKHVTHNEALRALDALVFLALEEAGLSSPPADPQEGARYLVAAAALGGWSGHEGEIAVREDGAWVFHAAAPGWLAVDLARSRLMLHDLSGWRDLGELADEGRDNLARLGVNATADATNRLAVRGPSSLFTAETGSHRLAINKQASADTASLLLQTGYEARAEIGLLGTDRLSLAVGTGGALLPALTIDGATRGVGIGTTAPGAELEVADSSGDGDCRIQIRAGSEIAQFGVSSTQVFIDTTDEKPFVLYGNGQARMIVTAEGRIGVGANPPTTELHVHGALRLKVYDEAAMPDAAFAGEGAIALRRSAGSLQLGVSDGTVWHALPL